MSTDFDVELTDTLRDIADEMGPDPVDMAATALRGGRQIRRRRSAVAGMAAVVALAAVAAPTVVVMRHTHGSASAASHQRTIDFEVWMSTGNRARATTELRKRFTDAGFTAVSTSLGSSSEIQFRLGSTLSQNQMQDRISQLTGPGIMEFRTVLNKVVMPTLTMKQQEAAMRQPKKKITLATVKAKLGPAYAVASSLTGPIAADDPKAQQLAPFASLNSSEVALLPARIQFNVPTINCAQIVDPEPIPPTAPPAAEQIATCDDQSSTPRSKYLLSAARLTNVDIASATPVDNPGHGWGLKVTFTADGQQRWTDLTNQLNTSANQAHKQVAVVVDGVMLAAPEIPSPSRTSVTITPTRPRLTEASATELSIVINGGPLPTRRTWTAFEVPGKR